MLPSLIITITNFMAVADIARFQKLLSEAKSALIVLPQNPSFDAVAGGLSLSLALAKNSILGTVACPTQMIVEFNRLVGVDKVRDDLGDSNLVIAFADYPPDDIERVTCGIEGNKFTLLVLPKPGNKSPREDQVSLSYSGASADIVIAVGANYPEGIGKFAQKKDIFQGENLALLANIPLAGWTRAIELIDASGSSISEVAYDVIEGSGLSFDEDIATNLFLGIEAGTRNFTSQKVNAETFSRVANLLRRGAKRALAPRVQFQQKSTRDQNVPRDFQDQRPYKGQMLP